MVRCIVLLVFITSFARAQNNTKIPIDNFPDLRSVWSTDDYSAVLKTLREAQASGIALPTLTDPYYREFFTRLTADENLERFGDPSIPQAQRLQEAQPFTQVIPDVITLFSSAGRENETVVLALFTMKATAQFVSTLNEIVPCTEGARREEMFTRMRSNKGLFMVLNGGLDLLKEGPSSKVDLKYLAPLASWYSANLPLLMEWLTPEYQQTCRERISKLTKKKYSLEIRNAMQQTLAALDAYKPQEHLSFATVMEANELLTARYKNTILGLEITAPKGWVDLSEEKLTHQKTMSDTLVKRMGGSPEQVNQTTVRLLNLQKAVKQNGFNPTLIVSIENIECTGVTQATPYLRQVQTLLSQAKTIVYNFGFMSTISINNRDFALLDTRLGTTNLKQDYMVTVLDGKYALVYIATYVEPADGEALRALAASTAFTGNSQR